ncbi:hypothetical protein HK102_000048 [Quaeritorhiza haematococci]|nr:hypothetical protein HK102_000048 [Quaeritorhiza haematococci]
MIAEKAGLEAQITAQFENELSTMRHDIEENEQTFTARIAQLQQEVWSMEEQLSIKEKDIEDKRRAFETQSAQLQEEKAGLEAQISDLQQDFQEKENNLTSQLLLLQQEKARLEECVSALRKDTDERERILALQGSEMEKHVQELRLKLQEKDSVISDLRMEVANAQEAESTFRDQWANVSHTLQCEIAKLKEENEQLIRDINAADKATSIAELALKEQIQKFDAFEDSLDQTTKDLESMRNQNSEVLYAMLPPNGQLLIDVYNYAAEGRKRTACCPNESG